MQARFEHYVIVDWSAASGPKTGRDSIWICHRGPHGETCSNPATRHRAKAMLGDILTGVVERGERAILGFDFPFGYPAGFARRLGLVGTPWRAVWDEIAALLEDDAQNNSNRFAVGAAFNERVSGGSFPFWGCPPGRKYAHLGPRHHRGHGGAEPLQEQRLIDRWMTGAQPCWKLAYTGSVGSQALTGIPVVRALRDDPRWAGRAQVWPFETDLALPEDAAIILAEVWPSWWRDKIRPEYGPPKDKAQVCSVAEIFAEQDRAGALAGWFCGDPNLTDAQRRVVVEEEAWTLGVTGAKAAGIARSRRPEEKRKATRHAAGRPLNPPRRTVVDATAAATPSRNVGEGYGYLRDPAAIYRRSFAAIRAEADLPRFPAALRPVALRLAHAAGDASILADLAWSRGAVAAGRRALAAGAAILVDSEMTAAGIGRAGLPADNAVICTLHAPAVRSLAARLETTRSAAATELWRPFLAGAVVAIGNAPTALFHLLEMLAAGAPRPALVLGFPVGFVGAAEAKAALIGFGGLACITLAGRRGGSALAAAALNALCGGARR
ncbi:MAG TPA: precorrin-8X methylmutase [Stellaceae bacterium]|nr:precorrin-8X methylmutase [Stellaceae bacterium]